MWRKYLFHVKINWEHYKKNGDNLTQCRNCQLFGHGTRNCKLDPKYMICGDSSHTKDYCSMKETTHALIDNMFMQIVLNYQATLASQMTTFKDRILSYSLLLNDCAYDLSFRRYKHKLLQTKKIDRRFECFLLI